jgi:putative transposase
MGAEKQFLEKGVDALHKLIESALHRFFTSYSMSFNKMFERKGNLFHRPFKRLQVEEDVHLFQLIVYVHANTVKHGISNDFTIDKWSSYSSMLSAKPTALLRKEVLEIFGGAERFVITHMEQVKFYYEGPALIED